MTTNTHLINTIDLVKGLLARGVDRIVVIARHSARRYDPDRPELEPFMGLTGKGKELALALGRSLPDFPLVRFYSSPVVRCVETAYQVEKGYLERGVATKVAKLNGLLTGFFVKDGPAAFRRYFEQGSAAFFRSWFKGEVPEIMADAEESAESLLSFLKRRLTEPPAGHLDICISHDWNLYLLREIYLHQSQEAFGPALYLESIAVFEQDGQGYMANHLGDPVSL